MKSFDVELTGHFKTLDTLADTHTHTHTHTHPHTHKQTKSKSKNVAATQLGKFCTLLEN